MEIGVQEAALRLGLSVDTVRRRVKAGRLEHRKAPDGRVLVILPDEDWAGDQLSIARKELADAKSALVASQARVADLEKMLSVNRALLDVAEREVDYLRSAHAASLVVSQRLFPERPESTKRPPWWQFWRGQAAT